MKRYKRKDGQESYPSRYLNSEDLWDKKVFDKYYTIWRKFHDPSIKTPLVMAYVPLIHELSIFYSKRAKPISLTKDDLFGSGYMGLERAFERYNTKKGASFNTYARWWIRQAILRDIQDHDWIVRFPVHSNTRISKLKCWEEILTKELSRKPTLEELSEKSGISVKTIDGLVGNSTLQVPSLDFRIGNDEETETILLVQSPYKNAEHHLTEESEKEAVRELVHQLSPKYADVLERRYGLNGYESQTLECIGKELGLTKERIRQIEVKAINQIRIKKNRTLVELGAERGISKERIEKNAHKAKINMALGKARLN